MKEPKSQADLDFGDFLFQPLLKHAESKIIKRVGCFAAYCPPVAFLVQERLRAAESEYGFILGWEDLICRCWFIRSWLMDGYSPKYSKYNIVITGFDPSPCCFLEHSFACRRSSSPNTWGLHLPLEERFALADASEPDMFVAIPKMKWMGKMMISTISTYINHEILGVPWDSLVSEKAMVLLPGRQQLERIGWDVTIDWDDKMGTTITLW